MPRKPVKRKMSDFELLPLDDAGTLPKIRSQFPVIRTVVVASVLAICAVVLATNGWSSTKKMADRDILPDNVRPYHYALHVYPDLEKFTFEGTVDISLDVLKETNAIQLNAVEIEIYKPKSYLTVGADKVAISEISYDKATEVATLRLDQSVKIGKAELHLEYQGVHNDKMAGFYRSQYQDQNGQKKSVVVTQFEPTDARKCLPCFDEPALKATFAVKITCLDKFTALSNMNEISSVKVAGGKKEVTFAKSVVMSTYLLAMTVGEYDYVEDFTQDAQKTRVRVYAPTGQAKDGKFALGVACKTLPFFADYFGEPYPLPKMDMVAIPDFAAGAMENWGLVTYRTVMLLFDEKSSSARSKQSIAYVVGHELAHQWFGNLVTFDWWQDLWLNEGFATWAGWLSTAFIFPEWSVWTQFVNDDLQRGLGLDALRSSHPIEVPVKNPSEIHQIFDAISYSKGASVIRMLANYLGEKTFQQGVRSYLQQFKFNNAQTKDLWHHLQEASGKPVGKLMNSWTRQMGFPVVDVKRQGAQLEMSQKRFLSSGDATPAEDEALWFAPLQIVTESKPTEPSSDVLDAKTGKVTMNSADGWFKVNYEQSGFYRTNYQTDDLKLLGKAVKSGSLTKSDRVGLLNDVFALAQAGFTGVVAGLDLISNFGDEDSYIVWNEIAAEIGKVRSVWWEQPQQVTDKLKELTRQVFHPVANKMGWEYNAKEGHLVSLLRTLVIGVAGRSDDPEVVKEAQRRFKSFVGGDENAIHPNLRGAVFGIVLKNGGQTEYDQVLKIFRETKVADQKLVALGSLGSTEDVALLKKTLDFGLSAEVRPQDIIYVVGPVAANIKGRELAWKWVKDNWQVLYDRYYAGSMSLLSRIVSSTTENFSSDAWYAEVSEFFKGKEVKNIDRAIKQSLEKVSSQTQWLKRDAQSVKDYFNL